MTRTAWAFALLLALAQPAAWQDQASGVTARFRGVSAVSDRVAWASGSGGTVVRTLDGGATWQVRPVPGAEKLDFRDVDAFSETVAYILSIGPGEASRIFKTTDGGATWTEQFKNTDPKVFLDAMTFRDKDHGVAFSDSVDGKFVILHTANGGTTWERIPADALPPALDGEGAFAGSGTNIAVVGDDIWIGTTASRVLHSADNGRTWSVTSTPLATGQATGIFSVAFRDRMHGVAVGGNYSKEQDATDNAVFTSDGGRTWSLAKPNGLSGFRSVVTYVPGAKSSLIAVGPSGADRSDDDGRTWSAAGTTGFHAFSFAPRTATGWGAGERGRIARLTVAH
ncbi:MAG TPA: YCF48-related protein [Vicinamibacterales bacterium]